MKVFGRMVQMDGHAIYARKRKVALVLFCLLLTTCCVMMVIEVARVVRLQPLTLIPIAHDTTKLTDSKTSESTFEYLFNSGSLPVTVLQISPVRDQDLPEALRKPLLLSLIHI